MKISLIIVCYNSADTIEETFDSVLNQTYDDMEYIVVDGKRLRFDGSAIGLFGLWIKWLY